MHPIAMRDAGRVRTRSMNVANLVQAIHTLNAYDAFRPRFSRENWRVVGSYLIRRELKGGDVLIYQGDSDRTMFFLESGTLQVYVRGTPTSAAKIALLRAGAIVGEPALFGDTVRMAQVDAIAPSVVWALSRTRLDEMLATQPELAYEILRASGAVMAERMRGTLDRGTPMA
jgi:CRP-like cAMP-binding protein